MSHCYIVKCTWRTQIDNLLSNKQFLFGSTPGGGSTKIKMLGIEHHVHLLKTGNYKYLDTCVIAKFVVLYSPKSQGGASGTSQQQSPKNLHILSQ